MGTPGAGSARLRRASRLRREQGCLLRLFEVFRPFFTCQIGLLCLSNQHEQLLFLTIKIEAISFDCRGLSLVGRFPIAQRVLAGNARWKPMGVGSQLRARSWWLEHGIPRIWAPTPIGGLALTCSGCLPASPAGWCARRRGIFLNYQPGGQNLMSGIGKCPNALARAAMAVLRYKWYPASSGF